MNWVTKSVKHSLKFFFFYSFEVVEAIVISVRLWEVLETVWTFVKIAPQCIRYHWSSHSVEKLRSSLNHQLRRAQPEWEALETLQSEKFGVVSLDTFWIIMQSHGIDLPHTAIRSKGKSSPPLEQVPSDSDYANPFWLKHWWLVNQFV